MHQIWLASCGCWHQAWESDYYPDDLPASWRFSYYSNEFSAIYLRHSEWVLADTQSVATWMEDCDAEFEFLLEVDLAQYQHQAPLLEKALENLTLLSEQVAALVFRGDAPTRTPYQERIRQAAPRAQLFAQFENHGSSELPRLQQIDRAEDDIHANLLLVNFKPSPKQIANYLKSIVKSNHCGGLIFCGDAPSVDSLRQAEGLLPFLLTNQPAS